MAMTPAKSNSGNCVEHDHDAEAGTMLIRFKTGLYRVSGVSAEMYEELKKAENTGSFYNARIRNNRDNHTVTRVEEEEEKS